MYNQNPNNTSITGASLSAGNPSRYIEGKLRWAIANGTSSYGFPIGGGLHGVEPFGLITDGASNLTLEGYITPQSEIIPLLNAGITYHDVGEPVVSNSTVASNGCIGGPDGIVDKIELNVHTGIGWQVNNIAGSLSSYSISVSPSSPNDIPVFNPYSVDADCGNINILYVSKDLIPGGLASNLIAGTQDWPTTPGYQLPPHVSTTYGGVNGYALNGMSSFSTFGAHTTVGANVALPVEYLNLDAFAVNNEFINVEWTTATEINNEGFDLERSEDGLHFTKIAYIAGNGNTNTPITYLHSDYNVQKGKTYYYRLKQIDFDGNFNYSYIVNASLNKMSEGVTVSIFPNPSSVNHNLMVEIESAKATTALIQVTDIIGKEILNETIDLNVGKNTHKIKNGFLAVGQYQIFIKTNEQQFNHKIIITE